MADYSFVVMGKVQGVYYRQYTKENAIRLGLFGFVENKSDGSVYIEVSGDDFSINKFLELCQIGPPNSVVSNITCSGISITHFGDFYIKR